jgi:hypothetical protein
MKKLLVSTALLLGLVAPAFAQVNSVPQVGVITGIVKAQTYTASSVGLVPAASATDFWCLSGSTSKNVHVREFVISGTAGTAISTPVLINLNHSLDTAGTPATGVALPVAAPMSTLNGAATATVTAWTANGTVNDTSPNLLGVALLLGGRIQSGLGYPQGSYCCPANLPEPQRRVGILRQAQHHRGLDGGLTPWLAGN